MASGRSPYGSGNQATAWLATVFTLTGGVFACLFVLVSNGESPGKPMLITLSLMILAILILWLLRDKPPEARQHSLKLWYWWKKEESDSFEYKPRPRKRSHKSDFGTQTPPTLESIRERTDDQRTWVPSIRNIKENTGDSTTPEAD